MIDNAAQNLINSAFADAVGAPPHHKKTESVLNKALEDVTPPLLASGSFFVSIAALWNFVVSGLLAVLAMLGETRFLLWSLGLLMTGLGFMLGGWFLLRKMTETLKVSRALLESVAEKVESTMDQREQS